MAEIKIKLSVSEYELLASLCDDLLSLYDLEHNFEIVEDYKK